MEDIWNEIDEHLSVIHGNLGICCQEYCDAPNAIHSLEKLQAVSYTHLTLPTTPNV